MNTCLTGQLGHAALRTRRCDGIAHAMVVQNIAGIHVLVNGVPESSPVGAGLAEGFMNLPRHFFRNNFGKFSDRPGRKPMIPPT